MKKIKIFTVVDQRPDLIETQFKSIKKYLKDLDWEFIVVNNAIASPNIVQHTNLTNNISRSELIKEVCIKNGIKCIEPVLINSLSITNGRKNFDNGMYLENQRALSYPLNWVWQNYITEEYKDCINFIIHSDMFLIKEISIEELIGEHNLAFIPQYRGSKQQVFYPWDGVVIVKPDCIPSPKELNWDSGFVLGEETDVGGFGHFYLESYKNFLDILYIEFWNVASFYEEGANKYFNNAHLNGNARFNFYIENDIIQEFKLDGNIFQPKNKIFNYESEKEDYVKYVVDNFLDMIYFLKQKNINFPQPMWCDFIKLMDDKISNSFIFHYKSGSNYQPFSTKVYNETKTEQLHKLLGV
jgi:hypothetical protein